MKISRLFSIFFVIGFYANIMIGQNNPFQIKKPITPDSTVSKLNSDTTNAAVSNPFILRKSILSGTQLKGDNPQSWSLPVIMPNIPIGRLKAQDIKPILFWTLLFLSFLLAVAMNINRTVTAQLSRSLFNVNYLNLMYRENKDDNRLIYILLYGLYFVSLSIFAYVATNLFWGLKHPLYLFWISLLILGIYTTRHLSLKVIGWVFKMPIEADRYLFSIVIFGSILAIILVPVNFIISFVDINFAKNIIKITSLIFILLYIYRQLREILATSNLWGAYPFHFLLYLCTCEIAPLFILGLFIGRQGLWG